MTCRYLEYELNEGFQQKFIHVPQNTTFLLRVLLPNVRVQCNWQAFFLQTSSDFLVSRSAEPVVSHGCHSSWGEHLLLWNVLFLELIDESVKLCFLGLENLHGNQVVLTSQKTCNTVLDIILLLVCWRRQECIDCKADTVYSSVLEWLGWDQDEDDEHLEDLRVNVEVHVFLVGMQKCDCV